MTSDAWRSAPSTCSSRTKPSTRSAAAGSTAITAWAPEPGPDGASALSLPGPGPDELGRDPRPVEDPDAWTSRSGPSRRTSWASPGRHRPARRQRRERDRLRPQMPVRASTSSSDTECDRSGSLLRHIAARAGRRGASWRWGTRTAGGARATGLAAGRGADGPAVALAPPLNGSGRDLQSAHGRTF